MPKMIMRGAYIRYMDVRKEKESGVFCRLHCTASFSEPVREAMEWGPLPEGMQSAKLDGRLSATHLIMTPNGHELKRNEIQLDVNEVADFQAVRVQSDDGESTRIELRFIVRTGQEAAEASIGQYMRAIGRGEAQFRVAYDQQDELDLKAEGEDEDTADDEQEPIEANLSGPALASHQEIAGGTTAALRKARAQAKAAREREAEGAEAIQ